MSRVLRTVLLWMLALAIPASGFAASAPPWCGGAADQVARHDVTAGLAMHAHWQEHARNGDTPASADPAPAVSCHTCAAHCSAAAITAHFSAFEPDAPAHHYGPTILASTLDVVHAGLERPPRTALR